MVTIGKQINTSVISHNYLFMTKSPKILTQYNFTNFSLFFLFFIRSLRVFIFPISYFVSINLYLFPSFGLWL